MNNHDIEYALNYHESTKHSKFSIQLSQHYLDWDNKPRSFKFYENLRSVALPIKFPKPTLNALEAISRIDPIGQRPTNVDLEMIAEILFYSAGITREMKYSSGTIYMRAASATGALYPIELYLFCKDIAGLGDGVYHFNPGDFTLTNLREGDHMMVLAEAAGDDRNITNAPLTIIFSSIAWRNAWKYQARSYRHWFWDAGVIASNLLATTVSMGLYTKLRVGFDDTRVNRLLGLQNRTEASLALAIIGTGLSRYGGSNNTLDIQSINFKIIPLSRNEVQYPDIWKMHESSYLHDKYEVMDWDNIELIGNDTAYDTPISHRRSLISKSNNTDYPSLSETILLRGSSRQFSRNPISFLQLSNILHSSTQGIPLDFTKGKLSAIKIFFIVNNIEELNSGSYYFNRSMDSIDQLKKEIPRDISGNLCLGQSLFSDASVVFFIMTDLELMLNTFGNRGYRAAQFEAGIIAGKIYLAAYAQGIGASGSTFFDDAVTNFFLPHAKNKSTMIAVGVGIPAYKSKSGKILAGKWNRQQLLDDEIHKTMS